jgi:hypothetical protein
MGRGRRARGTGGVLVDAPTVVGFFPIVKRYVEENPILCACFVRLRGRTKSGRAGEARFGGGGGVRWDRLAQLSGRSSAKQ